MPDGTGSPYIAGATMAMGPADLSLYAVWTKQVRYSGRIVLPSTSTPNIDRWYVLVENNTTGEPSSGKYFHGDLNGNGIPDWGIVGSQAAGSTDPAVVSNGDYDDGISPSGILADLDMDSSSFLFSL